MPYQHLADGLYLVRQQASAKVVDHYGILDVGNRLGLAQVSPGAQPVVIHQNPAGLVLNWLQDTGSWTVLNRVPDEADAVHRVLQASRDTKYMLFENNCEHFARYVALGQKHSTQVHAAVFVAGLVTLAWLFRN